MRTIRATIWATSLLALGCADEDGMSPLTSGEATGSPGTGSGVGSDDATAPSTTGANTSAGPATSEGSEASSADTGSATEGDTDDPPGNAGEGFYGVPWTGDGIGELRIQGEDFFSVSLVMPFDGDVDRIRQYFIGVGECSYGCGDGGEIELRIHRDADGIPGEEIAATMLTPDQVASVRNNDDVFFPVTFESFSVSKGERIWMVASNHHAAPESNYISLDPFNLHARWADPDLEGPVSSVDPEDRLWTVYDANLDLLRHKHHILAAYYTDDRIAGHGYVMCSPHCSYASELDKWANVGGDNRVRQRFTPTEPLTFERVDFRLLLAQGDDPLEVTIRQGGEVVATGSAADWVAGGWGYVTGPSDPHGYGSDMNAQVNAQWGAVQVPLTTLEAGVEAEVEIAAPAGTEYQAVGQEWGAPHIPDAYHDWPEAEKTSGADWIGFDERDIETGHLNFFFPLIE